MGQRRDGFENATLFWKNYSDLLEAKNEKEYFLLEKANIPRSTMATARARGSFPHITYIRAIAKALDVQIEDFFSKQDEPVESQKLEENLPADPSASSPFQRTALKVIKHSEIGPHQFRIPLLSQRVSAGHGATLQDVDEEQALIPAPAWLSRYGRDVAALMVTGDSMEPTLRSGDLVVCDTHGWEYEGIYVIQLGDQVFVKRLQKLPRVFRIISDNPRYPVMEEPIESQDLRIIGLVHCVVRMMD